MTSCVGVPYTDDSNEAVSMFKPKTITGLHAPRRTRTLAIGNTATATVRTDGSLWMWGFWQPHGWD